MKQLLVYIYEQYKNSHLQTMTASMSFVTLLSIVPLLGIAITFFNLSGQLHGFYENVEPLIFRYFNASTSTDVTQILRFVVDQFKGAEIGVTSFLIFIYSSSRLVKEMDYSFQLIWHTKRQRAYWKRMVIYGFVVFALPILAVFLLSLLTEFRLLTQSSVVFVINCGLALSFYLIYRFVPPAKIRNRVALMSSLVTIFVMVVSQKLFFSVYVNLFEDQKVYGSFIFIPIFLAYIYLMWAVFLSGAILCAGLQKGFSKPKQA